MKKIVLYGNGSSLNHGCEAIVRGTANILGDQYDLISSSDDYINDKNNISDLVEVVSSKISYEKKNLRFLSSYISLKLFNNIYQMDSLEYLTQINNLKKISNLAFSVGGDNYCYPSTEKYSLLNKDFHNNKFKTVLWGCSIEPKMCRTNRIINDLKAYDLIIARESISYDFLRNINSNTFLLPDPAFYMKKRPNKEYNWFFDGSEVVGINISPLIQKYENIENIILDNFSYLITKILENPKKKVALIPHVTVPGSDDRLIMLELLNSLPNNDRILLIDELSSEELKYIISKCSIFIGCRTHSLIAAYSTYVPSLAIGYSTKAIGIATDIFGTSDNYVLAADKLCENNEIYDSYRWIEDKKNYISQYLSKKMPIYLESKDRYIDILKKLENKK